MGREDRNYFIMRFRSILYTVMFIVVIMATFRVSLVFGNRIQSHIVDASSSFGEDYCLDY